MADRPYSRVYHTIVDDPDFAGVFDDDHALAWWLRMLIESDAMYPASAPMPRRTATIRKLIATGLVIERPGNRFSIRGQEAERERRSHAARNAAAMRWHSDRNADPMPRRDETRQEEKTRADADASPTNGDVPDVRRSVDRPEERSSFMGFRPKRYAVDDPTHAGQHPDCLVCHPVEATTPAESFEDWQRRKHAERGEP